VPRLEVNGRPKVPEKRKGRRSGEKTGSAAGKLGFRTKKLEGEAGGEATWRTTMALRDLKWKGQSRGKAQKRSRERDAIGVDAIEGVNNVVTKA
jgi:hypothetical protein